MRDLTNALDSSEHLIQLLITHCCMRNRDAVRVNPLQQTPGKPIHTQGCYPVLATAP